MAPRETENNAYAKFWGDKEYYGMLWYFLEWSIEHLGMFSFLGQLTPKNVELQRFSHYEA